MRCILGLQCVEQRTRPDDHPREEHDHPNRRHAIMSIVRIAPCQSCLEQARCQDCHPPLLLKVRRLGPPKKSRHEERKLEAGKQDAKSSPFLETQFDAGRRDAAITSRPGQVSRADGAFLKGIIDRDYQCVGTRRLRTRRVPFEEALSRGCIYVCMACPYFTSELFFLPLIAPSSCMVSTQLPSEYTKRRLSQLYSGHSVCRSY